MASRAVLPFVGAQHATDAAAIQSWVERAHSGERMIYCSAPELIRGEGSRLVQQMEIEGLVRPHQARREGGGWDFLIVRTGRAMPRAPRSDELTLDEAGEAIFRAMKRAANLMLPCPSDADLARMAGLETRDMAKARIRKLRDSGRIATQQVTEDGVTTRVVTVAGKSSLPPPKMLAAQRAMQSERGQLKKETRR